MKIFFDTEFTGLHANTTLISIGMISDNNRKFYAELTDFSREQLDDWIKDNVISNLMFKSIINKDITKAMQLEDTLVVLGNKQFVRMKLLEWLDSFEDKIQFVSDVCHYDMVLLIDLLAGNALNLPDYISPVCHDINQDIAYLLNITDQEAFNLNREKLAGITNNVTKHNALFDAEVIKAIHDKLPFLEIWKVNNRDMLDEIEGYICKKETNE